MGELDGDLDGDLDKGLDGGSSSELDNGRGVLYPDALPRFHRRDVPMAQSHLARWYWIAQWDLPDGGVSSQSLLPFPASNLVVQPDGVTLSGPTTRASGRELSGRGWAFGVLLRPAGLVRLGFAPADIVDVEIPFPDEALAAGIAEHMARGDCAAAAGAMSGWWARVDFPAESTPEGAALADRLLGIVEADPGIVGVDHLAREMGMSTRALQRLAKQYIGLSPLRVIRRYRLQEAALRLRENPRLSIADVAAELGYADQSHLAADFRSTLGLAARDYRRQRQP